MSVTFTTDNKAYMEKYQAALRQLQNNITTLHGHRVLTEGGVYQGIWLEGGPHQGLIFGDWDSEIAIRNHQIFFDTADAEGFLHPALKKNERLTGHIQTVVPIAWTALQTALLWKNEKLLKDAYRACVAYDDWLSRYRNHRDTDLVEGHCVWDTGHDNSPRHAGMEDHCPDYDTKAVPVGTPAPYLAPDLSATKYAGRTALAEMCRLLEKGSEADQWLEKAETLKAAIFKWTWSEEDGCFYDVNRDGSFIRVKSDVLSRMLGAFLPDQDRAERLFRQQILNPRAFWTPYPMSSIAADDPVFRGNFPENSWGGASQALTALRAPIWFEFYGKYRELSHLMRKWQEALLADDGFHQQMNCFTGRFNSTDHYSPAMCVFLDFTARLYGVKRTPDTIRWGCEDLPLSHTTEYRLTHNRSTWSVRHENGRKLLSLNDRLLYSISGCGVLLTDYSGRLISSYATGSGDFMIEEVQHV